MNMLWPSLVLSRDPQTDDDLTDSPQAGRRRFCGWHVNVSETLDGVAPPARATHISGETAHRWIG